MFSFYIDLPDNYIQFPVQEVADYLDHSKGHNYKTVLTWVDIHKSSLL